MKRFAGLTVLSIIIALAAPAQAECVTASPVASAEISFEDVKIEMTENQQNALFNTFNPTTVCDDASTTTGAREAWFRITVGGDVVCERTDVDPSFDPFFFGAGINVDPASGCGARFSIASIQNPPVPYVEGTEVGTERNVVTEIAGEYWYGAFTGEVPQDTQGLARRGWKVSP